MNCRRKELKQYYRERNPLFLIFENNFIFHITKVVYVSSKILNSNCKKRRKSLGTERNFRGCGGQSKDRRGRRRGSGAPAPTPPLGVRLFSSLNFGFLVCKHEQPHLPRRLYGRNRGGARGALVCSSQILQWLRCICASSSCPLTTSYTSVRGTRGETAPVDPDLMFRFAKCSASQRGGRLQSELCVSNPQFL